MGVDDVERMISDLEQAGGVVSYPAD